MSGRCKKVLFLSLFGLLLLGVIWQAARKPRVMVVPREALVLLYSGVHLQSLFASSDRHAGTVWMCDDTILLRVTREGVSRLCDLGGKCWVVGDDPENGVVLTTVKGEQQLVAVAATDGTVVARVPVGKVMVRAAARIDGDYVVAQGVLLSRVHGRGAESAVAWQRNIGDVVFAGCVRWCGGDILAVTFGGVLRINGNGTVSSSTRTPELEVASVAGCGIAAITTKNDVVAVVANRVRASVRFPGPGMLSSGENPPAIGAAPSGDRYIFKLAESESLYLADGQLSVVRELRWPTGSRPWSVRRLAFLSEDTVLLATDGELWALALDKIPGLQLE